METLAFNELMKCLAHSCLVSTKMSDILKQTCLSMYDLFVNTSHYSVESNRFDFLIPYLSVWLIKSELCSHEIFIALFQQFFSFFLLLILN